MNIITKPGSRPAILLAMALFFGIVGHSPAQVVVELPGATVAGKTIADWTTNWWRWAAALAPPGDPFTDTTGQFANVNQSGPVFLLAGSPGGSNSRHFTVPANTYVLVPLLASEWSQLELGFDKSAAEIRQAAQDQAKLIDSLHATLDGTAISEDTLFAHREASPDFNFVAVANNQVGIFAVGNSGIAVADGYFLMLSPMTPGTHVLNYGGGVSAFPVFVDETDTITVVIPTTRYVDVNSASPTPPYTNWATAATTIQDAVDAAVAGDPILVTNGVYQTGGRAVAAAGAMTANRVAVDKAVSVQSANGPQFTMIRGYQLPGTTNGAGAIRCVYLTNGASLSGFTLTNGATADGFGGGIWCQSSNLVVISNCVLVGNSTPISGGGAYRGTLNDCTLNGNSVVSPFNSDGGGAHGSILNKCTLVSNSSATIGGGAAYSSLTNCVLTGNSAGFSGGGASESSLFNCVLTGNSATFVGGGVSGSRMRYCTVTGNSAGVAGGGMGDLSAIGCIIYFNTAPENPNYFGSVSYCCTTPQPLDGVGNISTDPQLPSASHLSTGSPCRGAGNFGTRGTDIDGEAWGNPPSIGCDEYHPGAVTGPLSVVLNAPFTNVSPGYPLRFIALIEGRTTASSWDFGDGLVTSNQPYASHAWAAAGNYAVVLRAYNESQPGGISATVTVHVVTQPVHYVSANSVNPLAPFASWATAATNIQDAVDAATVSGALVLVTNGNYAAGGRPTFGTSTNRVTVDKVLDLRSVNGPEFTMIQGQVPDTTNGDNAIRCVYLSDGARLSGFTLTNGTTMGAADTYHVQNGGGVLCESATTVVSNCVLVGNSAFRGGGGSHSGTLNNCTLIGNSAGLWGGGAYQATLNNCTITGNSAPDYGGGAYAGTLNNCIVYFNTASVAANYGEDVFSSIVLNYCCTTPLPVSGIGNITNAPLFMDQVAGNLRLQSNSPCINSGLNAYTSTGYDLDGNPRISGGTVDIGAYELQSPASVISYAWLQQYGLPTDGSADDSDSDSDLLNNWQEWIAGTLPTDATSLLQLLSPSNDVSGVTVSWQSVDDRTYFLERATNLGAVSPFSSVTSNIVGQAGTTTSTDTNAIGPGPFFYRVGVQQ